MFGLERIEWEIKRLALRPTKQVFGLIIGAMIVSMFLINARYITHQYQQIKPWAYITGDIDREAYITKHRPEFTVINFANKKLPETAHILGVFLGNRGYYLDRDIIFNFKMLVKSVKHFDKDDTIRSRLKQLGITHLIVRYDLFSNWVAEVLTPEDQQALRRFLSRHAELIFEANGHGLFRCL